MAKLHMLKSITDTINTSFILECGGEIFVLDGGFPSESEYMYEYLKGLGGKVDAWFLTHAHDDHVGCLLKILEEHNDITVDKIYYNFPSEKFAVEGEPQQSRMTTAELYEGLRNFTAKRGIPTITVSAGEKLCFSELAVRVLRTPNEKIKVNPINNSTTVYRFEINGKSILFLGDLGIEGGRELLEMADASFIKADYVQMAHHGQNGVEREVYEAICPKYALWCTPSWLWDNRDKRNGGGYDTGGYKTIVVRGWISDLGCVKRHYLMIDGTQIIEL